MKLRIIPSWRNDQFQIVSSEHGRVICSMDYTDLELAKRIVRRENGWWHTLFGDRRDAFQQAYDRWIWERNK